jgi:hypothetical protein
MAQPWPFFFLATFLAAFFFFLAMELAPSREHPDKLLTADSPGVLVGKQPTFRRRTDLITHARTTSMTVL